MAKDIRDFFKDDMISHEKIPKNHQTRFLNKLNKALPEQPVKSTINWFGIAASMVVFLGLSFGAYKYFKPHVASINTMETKTLGDVSPGLKKVEDYYLASIHLELSKMKPTDETKELFDSYLSQLKDLDEEYQRLSLELTESGPSELNVNALIDNLKFRLNLLYRLRTQLKQLNTSKHNADEVKQSI